MIYRDEIEITKSTEKHFSVTDSFGSVVLEIPKTVAPTLEAANLLLDWLAPVMNRSYSCGMRTGNRQGKDDLQRDLRRLLGTTSREQIDYLGREIDRLESQLKDA